MNLFEFPQAEAVHKPATPKRVGWSITRGVLLGMGLAALVFAYVWAPNLFGQSRPLSVIELASYFGLLFALNLWGRARLRKLSRSSDRTVLLMRLGSMALFAAAAGYLWSQLASMTLEAWAQAQPDFVTLVVVSGIAGLLTLRGGFRLVARERSRVSMWFAAAAAAWLSGERAINLGVVVDPWDDPRIGLAYLILIVTGVLCFMGVLSSMDWHIRRQNRASAEGGRLPDEAV